MIWESSYWKEPLLKTATWLRRMRLKARSGEAILVKLEKERMIGFYSVRKLLDNLMVSDQLKERLFQVTWYANQRPVDFLNWHQIDRLFDLEKPQSELRDIEFICDRLIHSFVFVPDFDDERLRGVFVATDTDRRQKVYFVSADLLV